VSIVIGAKWGKLLPVGEESKSVKLELRGSEARAKNHCTVGAFAAVKLRSSVMFQRS
jgi:hypothetical protein